MDAALKKSVITLNSQFRDHVIDPNSCDFITTPGFLVGLPPPQEWAPTPPGPGPIGTPGSGAPLFYGIEQIALLDATFVEHLDNGPIFSNMSADTGTIITVASTTEFPESGIIYIPSSGEQVWYNTKTGTQFLDLIREYNGSPPTPGPFAAQNIFLVGEPYFYIRLTEPSIGPFEAVEMSSLNQHYNRFFAKIPIDCASSENNIQQYFNHDGKWSSWTNWVNFGQPFPYIHKLRMETFRFYGNQLKQWPNPNNVLSHSLPLNITLKIDAHDNKMWDNRGIVVDASEDEDETSGEEAGIY